MKRILSVLAALAFAPAIAMAADTPAFEEIDANADGQITQDEAAAHPAVMDKFTDLDANQDGALSQDEYAAAGAGDDSAS